MPVTAREDARPVTALERGPVRAPLDACPRCDADTFEAEVTTDRPVFRCLGCGAAWLYELGYVRSVTSLR